MRTVIIFCIICAVYSFKRSYNPFKNILRRTLSFAESGGELAVECPLVIQLRQDSRKATLSKERSKAEAIQSIIAAVQRKEIDDRIPMTDNKAVDVICKLIKVQEESLESFLSADRPEQVSKIQFVIDTMSSYLPKQLTAEEVSVIVSDSITRLGASSIKDMGKVMTDVKPFLIGKTDMSKVGEVVKKKLMGS